MTERWDVLLPVVQGILDTRPFPGPGEIGWERLLRNLNDAAIKDPEWARQCPVCFRWFFEYPSCDTVYCSHACDQDERRRVAKEAWDEELRERAAA